MTAMQEAIEKRDWGHPDAPERFTEARECQDCGGKVNSYQQTRYAGTQGARGPLLCFRCLSKRIDVELQRELALERKRKEAEERWDSAARASVIGRRIRQAREAKGLSQKELAGRAGFKYPQRINAYERGRTCPGPKSLAPLARALGLDPRELMKV